MEIVSSAEDSDILTRYQMQGPTIAAVQRERYTIGNFIVARAASLVKALEHIGPAVYNIRINV
jgi:hypothetical protein